jgi:hypothetical protein
MHRSARSDLFFEGVVAEKCAQSNMCHILFSEGRARGLKERVPLKDINEISRAKIDVGQLSGWCSNKQPQRVASDTSGDLMIDCKVGEFVLIEGPEDSTWAAQLLEPYSGKVLRPRLLQISCPDCDLSPAQTASLCTALVVGSQEKCLREVTTREG